MGGRGTFSKGDIVSFKWETVSVYNGVKVLDLIDKRLSRKLPEESHTSNAYLLFNKKGIFEQYREYNNDHTIKFEIAFHPETKIDPSGKPVLHIHEYSENMLKRTTRSLTETEYNKYKKFFKGVLE